MSQQPGYFAIIKDGDHINIRESTAAGYPIRVTIPADFWPAIKAALIDQYDDVAGEGKNLRRRLDLGHQDASVSPRIGMELTLLAYAVEDATLEQLPQIIANWRGLAREERWWLYGKVNAAGGLEHDRLRGWRGAIKIALVENPIHET